MILISTPFSYLIFLFLLLAPLSSSSSVYEVLKSYGFPMGLFPKDAVETFSVDPNGTFQVLLRKPCITKLENEVKYGTNVTGRIGYGQISDLKGVLAQELFLWFPVKGVKVDIPTSGIIHFDIGGISKRLSLWLFDTPPECRGVEEEDRSGWGWSEDGVLFDADEIARNAAERNSGKIVKYVEGQKDATEERSAM